MGKSSSVTPRIQIDAGQLDKLPPAKRKAVEDALNTINEFQQYSPGVISDYAEAWKAIVENVNPNIALPPIARNLEAPPFFEVAFSVFFYPRFLEGAGMCFSSADFDYPRKPHPFVRLQTPLRGEGFTRGWEYLPLIRATVEAGNCNDPLRATRVLEDLQYIGGPNSAEIMDMVAQKNFHGTPEFSRAYLNLFLMYPVKERGKQIKPERIEGVRKALINLLPSQPGKLSEEDKQLFQNSLLHALIYLPHAEKKALVDAIISKRPTYKEMIEDMTAHMLGM